MASVQARVLPVPRKVDCTQRVFAEGCRGVYPVKCLTATSSSRAVDTKTRRKGKENQHVVSRGRAGRFGQIIFFSRSSIILNSYINRRSALDRSLFKMLIMRVVALLFFSHCHSGITADAVHTRGTDG